MSVKRTGITPAQFLVKCQDQYAQDLLTAVKEETARSYSNTGYLAANLTVRRVPGGGEIHAPAGRLDVPQTRIQFLERVWARVAASFLKGVR